MGAGHRAQPSTQQTPGARAPLEDRRHTPRSGGHGRRPHAPGQRRGLRPCWRSRGDNGDRLVHPGNPWWTLVRIQATSIPAASTPALTAAKAQPPRRPRAPSPRHHPRPASRPAGKHPPDKNPKSKVPEVCHTPDPTPETPTTTAPSRPPPLHPLPQPGPPCRPHASPGMKHRAPTEARPAPLPGTGNRRRTRGPRPGPGPADRAPQPRARGRAAPGRPRGDPEPEDGQGGQAGESRLHEAADHSRAPSPAARRRRPQGRRRSDCSGAGRQCRCRPVRRLLHAGGEQRPLA